MPPSRCPAAHQASLRDSRPIRTSIVPSLRSAVCVRPTFTLDAGATWLLTEIDPDDHDHAFGLCDLGLGMPEIGWVSLNELATVRGGLGLPIERDLSFRAEKRLSAYARDARLAGRIVV